MVFGILFDFGIHLYLIFGSLLLRLYYYKYMVLYVCVFHYGVGVVFVFITL